MGERTRLIRREDYRPPAYLAERVALTLELDPTETAVHTELALRRNPAATSEDDTLRLDGEGLALDHLSLDGQPLGSSHYTLDDTGLTVHQVPERFTLTTGVRVHPARNTALLGLYQAGDLLCTQCEPEAFRRITFFPDRPDVLARFRVTLVGDPDRYPVMLSNGNPVAEGSLDDGRRRVVWDDPVPKPCYLFAVVAGHLVCRERQHVTADGRAVSIRLHVAAGDEPRGDHALDTLKRAMAWDEHRYGLTYDLDVFNAVAVSQYTMGAMENKGLNVFNDRYALADAATATDRDHREIEAMVAHEFLHNWSGNRITCRDWFQLALKEGFTVLREQQFIADQGWAGVRRIEDTRLMRGRQFAEDAGPLAHAVRPAVYEEIENFFTDTVYSKGAELWRMLATLVGPTAYEAGCERYFRRHDGEATTIEALVDCIAEDTAVDRQAFLRWFEQPGTPHVRATHYFEPESGVLELYLRQDPPDSQPHAPPLPIPVAVGLLDAEGNPLPVRLEAEGPQTAVTGTRVFNLDTRERRLRLGGLTTRPVPSLLRDFSAPVHLHTELTDGDRAVLAHHDPDPVARWDAVRALARRCLDAAIGGWPARDSEDRLVSVYAALLDNGSGDPNLDAALLTLETDAELVTAHFEADVAAVHAAREGLRARLAEALGDRLQRTYEASARADGPYTPSPQQIGRRALRDVCLSYLAHPASAEGLERAAAQYRQADNLTDAVNALALLADSDHPEREALLADFRHRHRDRPLVLDKWLGLQARSTRADTLDRVRELTADPAFDLDQPNRVRALIESFVTANPLRLHAADGSGYRFLAEQVIALDPINPALAAGLLRHLSDWRRHALARGRLMREAVEHVAGAGASSRATREVTASILGDRP